MLIPIIDETGTFYINIEKVLAIQKVASENLYNIELLFNSGWLTLFSSKSEKEVDKYIIKLVEIHNKTGQVSNLIKNIL